MSSGRPHELNIESDLAAEKAPGNDVAVKYWDTEDPAFWEAHGKRIGTRNLWVSIPNLLLAFAVWILWSVIVTKMQKVHDKDGDIYSFSETLDTDESDYGKKYKALLFSLPAVAGLSGATLRIPNSFMIALTGGRNVIFLTTALLIVPMLGAGLALGRSDVSYGELVAYATLSGVGGGAFSSSMSNISYFFPKKEQGLALGLNAGLGNIGVAVMQLLGPVVMAASLGLGASAREGAYVQNAAWVWLPFLVLFLVLAFFFMNNLPVSGTDSHLKQIVSFAQMESLGFVASGLSVMVLVLTTAKSAFEHPAAKFFRIFVLALIAIGVQMVLIKVATPGKIGEKIQKQFAIFGSKHTWIMTYLYIMTFGSFIGFSSAFPKLILDLFGYNKDGSTRDDAPDPFDYAWLGAFVGSITRPAGGWLSDRFGGARVTQWATVVLVLSCVGVGVVVQEAGEADNPDDFFGGFLFLFLVLFAATGVGNGSTFRMVPIIFDKEHAGPVLGWTAAIAAYGAFVIPSIFGIAIEEGAPEVAFYGFSAYYFTCLGLNWWYYVRSGCEIEC